MHPDILADMVLFVHIVESGSLSAAGRALGLPKSTVSRRLSKMEQHLGIPLLHRSTRALTTTDFGQRYFQRVQPIVQNAISAQIEMESEHTTPSGLIRLSATSAFGKTVLAPKLFSFLAKYPTVRLDLRLTDERVPLIANGIDLAIRMGSLDDSELVARRLALVPMKLVASKKYLNTRGEPKNPKELTEHQTIVTRPDLDHWRIGREVVRPHWCMSTGNMLVTRDALLQGMGVGILPAFLADPALRTGQLIQLLLNFPLNDEAVSALWPHNQTPSLAVTTLVNYLVESLLIDVC